MDITPHVPKNRQLITGYGGGGFKINGVFTAGSLIIFPDKVVALTPPATLSLDALEPVFSHGGIELLLIGTGKTMTPIDPAIRAALKTKNIASDVMDTGAACRTYNVLLSEERRVAAWVTAI